MVGNRNEADLYRCDITVVEGVRYIGDALALNRRKPGDGVRLPGYQPMNDVLFEALHGSSHANIPVSGSAE